MAKNKRRLDIRGVYIYEFPDKSVYVGITWNYKTRFNQHRTDKKSGVYKKRLIHGDDFKYYEQGMDKTEQEVLDLEYEWSLWYEENGWELLNCKHIRSLGGNEYKYTKRQARKICLQYTDYALFKKEQKQLWQVVKKKWLELTDHMDKGKGANGYWDLDRCIEAAKKAEYHGVFLKKYASAYNSVKRNKWEDKVFPYLKRKQAPKGTWTIESSLRAAKKYSNRVDFHINAARAYKLLRINGILDKACSHMSNGRRLGRKAKWNLEACKEEALKYKKRIEFKKNASGAYKYCLKHKIMDTVCKHMK